MNDLDELYKSLLQGESKDDEKSLSINELIAILKSYWQYLWSKKWIIVGVALVSAILGFVYVSTKKINYEARYSFTIGGSSGSSGLSSITAMLGMSSGSMDAFSGDNILELLKSRSMVENALLSPCVYEGDSITLIEYFLICDSVRSKCENGEIKESTDGAVSVCDIHYPLGQDRSTFTRYQDSLLGVISNGMLTEHISASRRDKKLSYMDYSFLYTDEMFAKTFAEAHLREVANFYISTKTIMSRRNVESFQHRADSVQNELNRALERRAAYIDCNRNASGMYVSSQLQKIEVQIQVLSAAYAEMAKNIEVLKLDQARQTPLIQVIDRPILPLPNDKMRKLKGAIVGGFLGGFLICLSLIGYRYLTEMKRKLDEEETKKLSGDTKNIEV